MNNVRVSKRGPIIGLQYCFVAAARNKIKGFHTTCKAHRSRMIGPKGLKDRLAVLKEEAL